MEKLPAIIEESHPIWSALEEIQQARSNFQLEHFVLGQHDTPEQKYRQTLMELQEIIFAIRRTDLQAKKTSIEIDRLRSTGDEIDEIEAQIKELDLQRNQLARIGAEKEAKTLIAIWDSFEIKYTAEEIEANQLEYWDARLTRQAQLEALGSNGNVNWGSLDALRQIGKLEAPQNNDSINQEVKELK